MDFFERQDKARGKTVQLVLYFILAVLGIIASLYVVIVIIWASLLRDGRESGPIDFWNPQMLLWVGLGTILVVGLSSMSKIASLRSGGGAVARSLGGVKVEPFAQDPDERKLLNVVEEMAIASGTPVPEVYLLPEEGINAFAAGFSPDDAAIAVTRGCIQQLSRDELQGVVAHEFSHILNGDMRLNIRLMGVIFGILVLTVIGGAILRSMRYSRISGGRGNKKDGGAGAVMLAIILTAVALYVIGYIGVLFGRLIQSAVSRQREFLADASAVQFTRNPEGIAGALKRIGGQASGSLIQNAHAQETAHFFFASALKNHFGGPFATHPPLEKRIRAIDPQWNGKFLQPKEVPATQHEALDPMRRSRTRPPQRTATTEPPPIRRMEQKPPMLDPMQMVFTVGTLTAENLEQAHQTHVVLEKQFGNYLRNPLEARALIYALVLDVEESGRQEQLSYLRTEAGEELARTVETLYPRTAMLERPYYLSLIEMALPALNLIEPEAARDFPPRLRHLVEMDGRITVFEFVVTRLVCRHLERRAKPVSPGHYIWSAQVIAEPCSQLLSALVYLSTPEEEKANQRFNSAASVGKPLHKHMSLVPREQIDFTILNEALDKLTHASFGLRKQVLRICADAIQDDGVISMNEAELFRAVALALDCPMPPLRAS